MPKCFQYEFRIEFGGGQGIVLAENEDRALELILEQDSYVTEIDKVEGKTIAEQIELNEIDLTLGGQLFSMSHCH